MLKEVLADSERALVISHADEERSCGWPSRYCTAAAGR